MSAEVELDEAEDGDDSTQLIVDPQSEPPAPPSTGRCWVAVPVWLLVAAVLVLLASGTTAIALLAIAVSQAEIKPDTQLQDVCTTPGCVLLAAAVIQAMDTAADPCTDFHQYSCGGWELANRIPADKSGWSQFGALRQRNLGLLRRLLEASDPADPETRLASRFYAACMNTTEIDQLAHRPLEPHMAVLKDSPGDQWDAAAWVELSRMVTHLGSIGIPALFGVRTGADLTDSTRNVIWLGQAGLSLPSEYYNGKDLHTDPVLLALASQLAAALDLYYTGDRAADRPSNSSHTAMEVVRFEAKLAGLFAARVNLRDPGYYYNRKDVGWLQSVLPQFDWRTYLVALLSTGYPYDGITAPTDPAELFQQALGQEQLIVVSTVAYFRAIATAVASTSRRTVLWYLRWRLIDSMMPHLSAPFERLGFELSKAVYGLQNPPERWETCLARTEYYAGLALGKLYVQDRFSPKDRELAEGMVAMVRQATRENFLRLGWLDSAAQTKAREKADAMQDMMGYPLFLAEPDGVQSYYRGWPQADEEHGHGRYIGLLLEGRRWLIARSASDLRKPVDRTRWSMTPQTVNAYYSPSKNQMVFPAGILQPPFFSIDFPTVWNFGAIGVVMAHEMIHGFDDAGSKFDAAGNKNAWWSNSTRSKFEQQAQCMVEQYNRYKAAVPGDTMALNGNLTLGENIADNGGLKQAHTAWLASARPGWWLSDEARMDPVLPGVNLSEDQLFYVAYSQVWCSLSREDAMRAQLRTDPHSPGKYRIIGALSNSKEFATSFNCSIGSPMNPRDKCKLW